MKKTQEKIRMINISLFFFNYQYIQFYFLSDYFIYLTIKKDLLN